MTLAGSSAGEDNMVVDMLTSVFPYRVLFFLMGRHLLGLAVGGPGFIELPVHFQGRFSDFRVFLGGTPRLYLTAVV